MMPASNPNEEHCPNRGPSHALRRHRLVSKALQKLDWHMGAERFILVRVNGEVGTNHFAFSSDGRTLTETKTRKQKAGVSILVFHKIL
jgi:hypothetical protein